MPRRHDRLSGLVGRGRCLVDFTDLRRPLPHRGEAAACADRRQHVARDDRPVPGLPASAAESKRGPKPANRLSAWRTSTEGLTRLREAPDEAPRRHVVDRDGRFLPIAAPAGQRFYTTRLLAGGAVELREHDRATGEVLRSLPGPRGCWANTVRWRGRIGRSTAGRTATGNWPTRRPRPAPRQGGHCPMTSTCFIVVSVCTRRRSTKVPRPTNNNTRPHEPSNPRARPNGGSSVQSGVPSADTRRS